MRARTVVTAAAFALSASVALAAAPAPDLHGRYAPGGDCAKEPRVTLDASALVIQSAGQSLRLAPLDACQSCVGGASYQGIEAWVARLGPGEEPQEPMFRFNADEKRGALVVDKHPDASRWPAPLRAVMQASPLRRCAK